MAARASGQRVPQPIERTAVNPPGRGVVRARCGKGCASLALGPQRLRKP